MQLPMYTCIACMQRCEIRASLFYLFIFPPGRMNTRGMPPIFTWYWYATSRGVQCSRDAARAYSLHILVIGCPTQILIGRYARYAALKQTCSSWPNSFSYNVCDNLYYFTRSIGTISPRPKVRLSHPPPVTITLLSIVLVNTHRDWDWDFKCNPGRRE